jgi:hypothetical protein
MEVFDLKVAQARRREKRINSERKKNRKSTKGNGALRKGK